MRDRCSANPGRPDHDNYAGRGIRVCERWERFEHFLADMGERPPGMTLERKDVNGNYEPGNCRWATRREQANNTRLTPFVTARGRTMSMADWARETGIGFTTIRQRILRGWDPEEAVSAPANHANGGRRYERLESGGVRLRHRPCLAPLTGGRNG